MRCNHRARSPGVVDSRNPLGRRGGHIGTAAEVRTPYDDTPGAAALAQSRDGRHALVRVGLAGSSAIVTATVRALMRFYNVAIPKERLPGVILSVELVSLAFGGVMLAVAIKTPMWPLHTWLPDTYAEAPSPTTLLLTAGMSKMGVYALLRIALPIFPDTAQRLAPLLLGFAVVTVVAGAFAALAQTDLKRIMAYSSVNHVAFCLVGAFAAASASAGLPDDRAAAMSGAVLQMFVHGVTAGAMFFLLNALEERTGHRGLFDFGGLRREAPWFCGAFGVVTFASLGLPGLAGFVSELLVLRGTFMLAPVMAALSLVGVFVTAVFLLTIIQRVWWGPPRAWTVPLPDLTPRELVVAGVMVALIVAVGVMPGPFVAQSSTAVDALVALFAGGAR